jgi:hypothetical protein
MQQPVHRLINTVAAIIIPWLLIPPASRHYPGIDGAVRHQRIDIGG